MKSYILLDRSGSMATNWVETIGSLNAYVEGLAADKATKKAEVTVAAFDSAEPFKVLREGVAASEWENIAIGEAAPRASTPLYDAIGKLTDVIRTAAPKKASIVIITDGMENASKEIRKDAAKAMLDELRGKGFDVVFIGADFDAFGQSADLGTKTGATLNMSAGNYGAAMRGLANRTSSYASTGIVPEFTDDDRKKAAGKS